MRISGSFPTRSYDQRRDSSMPVLSYVHQLFNADQCQAYIHTLRWKDRPLQCPRCQSHNVGPWGAYHYQPGLQRYRCKEKACKRTFNDLMGTLLDGSKRSVMHWMLAKWSFKLVCVHRYTHWSPENVSLYVKELGSYGIPGTWM